MFKYQLLRRRRDFKRTADWVKMLYGRLMLSRLGGAWPFQNALVELDMKFCSWMIYVRIGTTDWKVVDEIFMQGEYELVINNLKKTEELNIIDLGSNIGISVLYWFDRLDNPFVIAVEPLQANVDVLLKNITNAGLGARVKVYNAAVGAKTGERLLIPGSGAWDGKLSDENCSDSVLIKCIDMPTLFNETKLGRVNLVKIDIEGAEAELFKGNKQWIDNVDNFIIELHDPYCFTSFKEDLEEYSDQFNFQVFADKGGTQVVFLARK